MANSKSFWPDASERNLLGPFYLIESISETLNVVYTFRFVYLYLVMERPEWAVLAMLTEAAAVLILEIPTGVMADRWGRKLSVISGGFLYALSLALIPTAVNQDGTEQLVMGCAIFALGGLGQTLVSGAAEAWVVDNLVAVERRDLIDRYFARIRSFASFGGVIAGLLALAILYSVDISRSILDLLWYVAAAGFFGSMLIAVLIPEHRLPNSEILPGSRKDEFWKGTLNGFRAIVKIRPLAMLTTAIVITSFSASIVDEAFDISMVTKGLDGRALALLGILTDFVGILAPLTGIFLARKFGASSILVVLLILPVIAVSLFLFEPALWMVIAVCLLLVFFDGIWDPIADAQLHRLIPSESRATVGSTVNQLSSMISLVGIGLFALLLGEHSQALSAATPDIIEAFSGGVNVHVQVPTGYFGLPIPDLAIVVFVASGLLAIPFLLAWSRSSGFRTLIFDRPNNRNVQ